MSDKNDVLEPNDMVGFAQLDSRINPKVKQRQRDKQGRPTLGKAVGGLVGIGLAATLLGYGLSGMREEQEKPLDTAEVEPWQGRGDGYATMTSPGAAQAATAPLTSTPNLTQAAAQPSGAPTLPPGPSASEQAMIDTLAALQEELAAMREEAANDDSAPAQDDGGDARLEALAQQVTALETQTEALRREAGTAEDEARELASTNRVLQAQLLAAQGELQAAQFSDAPTNTATGEPYAQGTDEDADRLAALAERRAQAEDLRQARIESSMIAFGGSASPSDASNAGGSSGLGQNEDFLRSGARAADVEQAVVIANPSRTVIQGTVVQAVMETAIDSSLPGAIRAVVSEDVHSYDGSRVLIPRGSKLIGRYNSQVEPTQRRLMIAWDRIITPDSQSVTLEAYGADELGRSGTTGRIDRRLGTRFGSAALVSIISALPAAAAASVEDPVAAELAEALGEDVEDAAGSVLDQYLAVPPTIYIDQGARITVMVDRDLELY